MSRPRLVLAVATAAAAAVLTGCTGTSPTPASGAAAPLIGPAPAATTPATDPAAGPSTDPAGDDRARAATGRARGTAETPATSVPARSTMLTLDVPEQPTGYATIGWAVPTGWKCSGTPTGVDTRDPAGRYLIRVTHEAAPIPGEPAQALTEAFHRAGRVPGVAIQGRPGNATAKLGVPWTDWRLDLTAGGQRRVAYVDAWVLNDRLITVYVSGPAADESTVAALSTRATALRIRTYIGHDA
jgi:hypothetical protein